MNKTATKVRCKAHCTYATQNENELQMAYFAGVYDPDPESDNGSFFKATPSFNMTVGVMNKQHFQSGKDYYVDLIPVEGD